jgi:putative transposase
MMGYDPAGRSIVFGKGANKRLTDLLYRIDSLGGEEKGEENAEKKQDPIPQSHKQEITRLWRKIKTLVSELHWKAIDFLLMNYDTILLPEFQISNMVKNKKLPRIVKRLLYMFSYYDFKMKLSNKCRMYGKKLVIVDESFTSKTCGKCGKLNDVGKDEVYVCKGCKLIVDRDVMASRNIFLKSVG